MRQRTPVLVVLLIVLIALILVPTTAFAGRQGRENTAIVITAVAAIAANRVLYARDYYYAPSTDYTCGSALSSGYYEVPVPRGAARYTPILSGYHDGLPYPWEINRPVCRTVYRQFRDSRPVLQHSRRASRHYRSRR